MIFDSSNMHQTSGSGRRLLSMAPSTLEDINLLDSRSAYSSPTSATSLQEEQYPPVVGLGISGSSLDPPFDHVRSYSSQTPASLNSSFPSDLVRTDNMDGISWKVDDDKACYNVYHNFLLGAPHSPLSWYGSQEMSASSSFASPIDVSLRQPTSSGQLPDHWASSPCSGLAQGLEAAPFAAGDTMSSHWNQQFFLGQRSALNASNLPLSNGFRIFNGSHGPINTPQDVDSTENVLLNTLGSQSPPISHNGSYTLPQLGRETRQRSPTKKGKGYRCSVCGYAFTRRSNCAEHEKKHDPSFKRSFHCEECGKVFSRNADLRRHTDNVGETRANSTRR